MGIVGGCLAIGGGTLVAAAAAAQDGGSAPAEAPVFRARAEARPEAEARAVERVEREQLDAYVVRSTPDALRWIPGVAIQQTTHGQASAYVRGVTGQGVLLAFDGIRLNNGTYRQGPNQYLFTVDSATLDHLDALRGSASTRWGSDALGGAILAAPLEPTLAHGVSGFTVHPSARARFASADLDFAGRLALDIQFDARTALLMGGGYRAAQKLQGSGVLTNPADGAPTRVPLIELDGRTQRGTGFRYGTFDARLVHAVGRELRFVAALYGFQQYDTPRADQCPPPFAPLNECLIFAEQFRHLAYASVRGAAGADLRELNLTVSYQRQHEWRISDRPMSYARTDFRDAIDTVGVSGRFGSRPLALDSNPQDSTLRRSDPQDSTHPGLGRTSLTLRGGFDFYLDHVDSRAALSFTDLGITRPMSRGQYTDGSRYFTSGVWLETTFQHEHWLTLRVAGRAGLSGARTTPDRASGTSAVRSDWFSPVARAGVRFMLIEELALLINIDQGFRAPNLDDLTSRQSVGPGFQFENAHLAPERSTTFELGAQWLDSVLRIDAFVYGLRIDGAMTRSPREIGDCPPATLACLGSWSRFQLINVEGESWIVGGELAARIDLPEGIGGRATLAALWGEGPNPAGEGRVPLSRIPPPQGTLEAQYHHRQSKITIGAAMRWAASQDRLAPSDLGDARIPLGGTPAYATFDLRAQWGFEHYFRAHLILENIFDQTYRVHGSGINSPGRGALVELQSAF